MIVLMVALREATIVQCGLRGVTNSKRNPGIFVKFEAGFEMQRYAIKSVRLWSIFKFVALISLFIYIIFSIFAGIIILISVAFGTTAMAALADQLGIESLRDLGIPIGGSVLLWIVFFFVGLIGYPLVNAIMGVIGGLIYNFIALMTGGIEVKLNPRQ
ncbi:MAG: DUF3566 domain-containing protein [Actinobacteria bacterium]|nr:DUF3566 domain-containing protein [Actinomycetota bacterium]